ncbi:hypothetical protein B0H14DRAFT_2569275 [Mycena olivaceomarginata]|nr:hypothetical protein B0H14DRAFT_2569275 [Mycena olivaceomarginata]
MDSTNMGGFKTFHYGTLAEKEHPLEHWHYKGYPKIAVGHCCEQGPEGGRRRRGDKSKTLIRMERMVPATGPFNHVVHYDALQSLAFGKKATFLHPSHLSYFFDLLDMFPGSIVVNIRDDNGRTVDLPVFHDGFLSLFEVFFVEFLREKRSKKTVKKRPKKGHRETPSAYTSGKCNPSGKRWQELADLAHVARMATHHQIRQNYKSDAIQQIHTLNRGCVWVVSGHVDGGARRIWVEDAGVA